MRSSVLHRGVASGLAALGGAFVATMAASQVWEVGSLLLPSPTPQAGARFGTALAVGDLDGDGDLDLAVGAPRYDIPGDPIDGGRVILFRNGGGRSFTFWTGFQEEGGDYFGAALAVGNFDGAGRVEVAVGAPRRDGTSCADGTSPCVDSGGVSIYRLDGLTGTFGKVKDLGELGEGNSADSGDQFGATLAVGDFDDSGSDDLAVGIPFENGGGDESIVDVGQVIVYYGANILEGSGLSMYVGAGHLAGTSTLHDHLGAALATGDFDGNGADDLAMGAPGRDDGGSNSAGAVHVVHGYAPDGLTFAGQGLLNYASFGQGLSDDDRFGAALAAGNFDQSPFFCFVSGPCQDDLAIGVPGDDRLLAPGMVVEQVGRVLVSYGSPTGLALDGSTLLSQVGLSDTSEDYDQFGTSLATGRLRFSGALAGRPPVDLAIGVPYEDLDGVSDTGYIHVAFGSSSGVAQGDPGEQPLPNRTGYSASPPELSDQWGAVMAVADLDGDGYGDLVVGMPGRDHAGLDKAGVVTILFGAMFADGFEIGSSVNWSSTVPTP
jgi:hypothetical protein